MAIAAAASMATALATVDRDAMRAARDCVGRGARARWWRRRGSKARGFWYEDADGRRISDETALDRVRSLAVPPAWTHVRICPSPRGKLQAVGIDTSGRIQYRYSATFAARQQRRKYEKIERFGRALGALRRTSNEHMGADGITRERVLAVVIRLVNDLYFRVGSEQSVRRYRTYGVTTLLNRHLTIMRGGRLEFSFVGKHQVRHRRVLVDRELASLLGEIKAVGKGRLFQYYDEDGEARAITPRDVNEYIKSAAGAEFSAKDFRTWGGTLMAAVTLAEMKKPETEREARRNVAKAIRRVAEHLGNTPAVCRSCYVHPGVIDRYLQGLTLAEVRPRSQRRAHSTALEYEPEEVALLRLLAV